MKHDELIDAIVEVQMLQFKIVIGFLVAVLIILGIAIVMYV